MEPLGKKLQQARLAKNISLEEAARVTKIRKSRIEEIEAEDFSSFPSLAYAKGFVIIYGKFLDVDVTPYLEAFETSDKMTVNGYSYLQGNGGAPPPAPIVRREPAKRPKLMPLFIAVAVLVVGLYVMKLFLDIQRITPPERRAGNTSATATATPTPASEMIVAPRAIPVETPTPAGEAVAETSSTPVPESTQPESTPTPRPTATEQEVRRPTRAERTPSPRPTATEQEVRRAIPVQPEDIAPPKVTPSPGTTSKEFAALVTPAPSPPPVAPPTPTTSPPAPTIAPSIPPTATPTPTPRPSVTPSPSAKPSPSASAGRVLITPVRKTFVRVIVDNNSAHPAFEGWLSPSDPPLSFRDQHVSVKALDPGAIQITRNGAPVRTTDSNVRVDE